MGQFNVLIGDAGSGSGYTGGGAPGASEGSALLANAEAFSAAVEQAETLVQAAKDGVALRRTLLVMASGQPAGAETLYAVIDAAARSKPLSAGDGSLRPGLPVRRRSRRATEPSGALPRRPQGAGAAVPCLENCRARSGLGHHVQVRTAARPAAAAFQALPGGQASRRHGGAVPVLRSARLQPFSVELHAGRTGALVRGRLRLSGRKTRRPGPFTNSRCATASCTTTWRPPSIARPPGRNHFGFDAFA